MKLKAHIINWLVVLMGITTIIILTNVIINYHNGIQPTNMEILCLLFGIVIIATHKNPEVKKVNWIDNYWIEKDGRHLEVSDYNMTVEEFLKIHKGKEVYIYQVFGRHLRAIVINEEGVKKKEVKKPQSTALIVVDVQNDFLPGGSLAVTDGDKIIPVINNLIRRMNYDFVVFTKDWHPENHCSFKIWPVHCVKNTLGAALPNNPYLNFPDHGFTILKKGQDPNIDFHSAFYDNDHNKSTGLTNMLRERGIVNVDVCGLAYDYCVKLTALDSAKDGFKTRILINATKAVDQTLENTEKVKEELIRAGVEIVAAC